MHNRTIIFPVMKKILLVACLPCLHESFNLRKKTELHKKGVGNILLDLCEYKCDFDGEGCDAVEKASEEKKCDKEGKSTKTRRHKINVLL